MDNEAAAAQEGRFGSASLLAMADALNTVADDEGYAAANFALGRAQVYATLHLAQVIEDSRNRTYSRD